MNKHFHTPDWEIYHTTSEMYGALAEATTKKGDDATEAYRRAAENETLAWLELDVFNAITHSPKIVGVIAASAVALWIKAGYYQKAKTTAVMCLNNALPEFAQRQLRELRLIIEEAILSGIQDGEQ